MHLTQTKDFILSFGEGDFGRQSRKPGFCFAGGCEIPRFRLNFLVKWRPFENACSFRLRGPDILGIQSVEEMDTGTFEEGRGPETKLLGSGIGGHSEVTHYRHASET
jgi:hypothetical protein